MTRSSSPLLWQDHLTGGSHAHQSAAGQLWLDALATELGASACTIDTHTDDLNCYLVWLDENSLALDDVGLEEIRDYIAVLDQRGYAGSTIARRITVARGLHKFLIAEELGSSDGSVALTCQPTGCSS